MDKRKKIYIITSLLVIIALIGLYLFTNYENQEVANNKTEKELINKKNSDVLDNIIISQDDSTKKMIESSQLRVWMQSSGRYGIQLKASGATIFYGQDSANVFILRSGSFPTGGFPGNFSSLAVKSFVINGNVIEQTRTDGVFDYIFRISIVNATAQGAYMKAEMEMKNLTGSPQNAGVSFNIDTMVNGNDASPFRIVQNGWEAFNNNVQATAYYQDVFHVTQADSIYLGHYAQQYPMPSSSFTPGQVIYPGDSGAGFYYNLESIGAYTSRKESWIMGMGPRNANPTFDMTSPVDNQTLYSGQVLNISGTAKDTDIGDLLQVKWAINGGSENILNSFYANGSNQSFNLDYTVPSGLGGGWHTLQVWVMDDKGGVSSSNTKRFFINSFTAPGAPTFSNVTNNSLRLSFDIRDNVASTVYELNKIHDGTSVNLGTTTSFNETGLSPNTLYQYKVRSKNTSGVYTGYSEVGSKYTLANTPVVGSIESDTLRQVKLNWVINGNPVGTTYNYEIRNASNNALAKSGNVTSVNSVTVTDLPLDVTYNVYLKAINYEGVSTPSILLGSFYQDGTAPVINNTITPNGWTGGDVTINLSVTDNSSGVGSIKLPDGTIVSNSDTATYTVSDNGSYIFTATDKKGNTSSKTVLIKNIDKIGPEITLSVDNINQTIGEVTINVSASDDGGGVKRLQMPDGSWVNGNTTTYKVNKNGKYTFNAEDIFGNKGTKDIDVTNITFKPELIVTPKNADNYMKLDWIVADSWQEYNYKLYKKTLTGDVLLRTTNEITWDDHTSKDVEAPNKPVISKVVLDGIAKNIEVDFSSVTDKGTDYKYYLEATGLKNNLKTVSSEVSGIITSGISGYSIVIDKVNSTIPDKVIETSTNRLVLNKEMKENFYVHVAAIDKAGNISSVDHFYYEDKKAPNLNLEVSDTALTNRDVTIIATSVDGETGVKRIKLPDGNWVNGDTATFKVTENGVYEFTAEDNVGNLTTKTITVTNIDKIAPVVTYTLNPSVWVKEDVTINVSATDVGAGVKEIKLPNGNIVTGDKASYKVTVNGEYTFIVTDKVGNVTTKVIEVKNIDKVKPTESLINVNSNWTLEDMEPVTITSGTDTLSGVDRVEYKIDGSVTKKGWTTYSEGFNISDIGVTKITTRTIDKVGNISNETVAYVKKMTIDELYFKEDRPSSVMIEWKNEITRDDNLSLVVYRNGSEVLTIYDGSNYEDKNLDYERDYEYQFVLVSESPGEAKTYSKPVIRKIKTGKPILIVELPEASHDIIKDEYSVVKPIFTNLVNIKVNAEFKQGGNLLVNYIDFEGNKSMNVNLSANIMNKFIFQAKATKDLLIPVNFKMEGFYVDKTSEFNVRVEEVKPVVKDVTKTDYEMKYRNK